MRRCDDTITFSPTIRILKTTIIGPFEGRFIPEDKLTTTPRNGFLAKVFERHKTQGNIKKIKFDFYRYFVRMVIILSLMHMMNVKIIGVV